MRANAICAQANDNAADRQHGQTVCRQSLSVSLSLCISLCLSLPPAHTHTPLEAEKLTGRRVGQPATTRSLPRAELRKGLCVYVCVCVSVCVCVCECGLPACRD
jgi:hypothetical protein